MPQTLIVAGIAALAILLIAVGVASSGGSGISDRLERYASGQKPDKKAKSHRPGPHQRPDRPERGAGQLQQGRRGSRLRGEPVARDRARGPEAEADRVHLHLDRVDHRDPGRHVHLLVRPARARQPDHAAHRRTHRFLAPTLLAEPPQERPPQRLQQAAARHDHPHRQRAARRFVLPPGHRAGRARVAPADLDRVQPRHPRGQPGPAVRAGAREHGPARALGRPRADGDRDLDPVPGGRQPCRDPGLDRLHDPRAGPHQGRDPHPDRPAAPVRLRRGRPADRPGGLPVRRRPRASWRRCSSIPQRCWAFRPASSS